jgi:hypothetical protein
MSNQITFIGKFVVTDVASVLLCTSVYGEVALHIGCFVKGFIAIINLTYKHLLLFAGLRIRLVENRIPLSWHSIEYLVSPFE